MTETIYISRLPHLVVGSDGAVRERVFDSIDVEVESALGGFVGSKVRQQ